MSSHQSREEGDSQNSPSSQYFHLGVVNSPSLNASSNTSASDKYLEQQVAILRAKLLQKDREAKHKRQKLQKQVGILVKQIALNKVEQMKSEKLVNHEMLSANLREYEKYKLKYSDSNIGNDEFLKFNQSPRKR